MNISNLSTNEQDNFEFESKLQIENIWNSHPNIEERIRAAKEKFITIADMEEEAFQYLAKNVPTSV